MALIERAFVAYSRMGASADCSVYDGVSPRAVLWGRLWVVGGLMLRLGRCFANAVRKSRGITVCV